MQVVYDLYKSGKIVTTYQSRLKAEAARFRLGVWATVMKRTVKPGRSPRWDKLKRAFW